MHRRWILGLIVAGVIAVPAAHAASSRGGERVIIGADEVVADDLVIAASELVIDGRIEGDLIAAAETITINGVVTGDVIAAANRITIAGVVEDDVRLAAGDLTLQAEAGVGDDMIGAAGTVLIVPASRVGGDLAVAGGTVTVRGAVARRADVASQQLVLGGPVGEAVAVYADDIVVETAARIGGMLTAHSPAPPSVADGAQLGGLTHIVTERADAGEHAAPPDGGALEPLFALLRQLVTLLLVGAVLVWLLPVRLARLADGVVQQPGPTLLAGALASAALVLGGSMLLLVTIIGGVVFGMLTLGDLAGAIVATGSVALAGVIVAGIIGGGLVAPVIVGYGMGRSLLARLRPAWLDQRLAPLALGVLLVSSLLAIPWVGGLIALLVLALALGVLWREWRGESPAA
ncbi:MAG: hypothetical protein KGS47_03305 [Chloroflexi bacterium]|nr:hypothetical protein [Chloroflexota bacterium]